MKRLAILFGCVAITSAGPGLAVAQSSPSQPNYPTNTPQGNVKAVPGNVCMFFNPTLGYSVPCSTDNPLPTAPPTGSSSTQVQGNVGSVTTDAGNPVKTGAVYNSSPPAPSSGQRVDAQADGQGDIKQYTASLGAGEDLTNNVLGVQTKPIIGTTYSASVDAAFGSSVTHNSKATAGQEMGFCASSTDAAIRYLQFYNSTGATTGTPILQFTLPAGSSTVPSTLCVGSAYLGPNGINFATGITWAFSTANGSYTAGTASEHTIDNFYE